MAESSSLREAVAELVHDGDAVAMEGFTHLIPFAAGHEVLRQGRRELELIRMTPDVLYDQLIGMGAARKLVFSYGGNPGVGSLHRFRDAIEHGWPRPIEIEEHSHAGMANRYVAGASRPAVRADARLRRHRPRCAHTRVEPSPARSPASSSSRCRRCARTSRSCTRRRPTAPATSSSGASRACRRRRCWRPTRVARHRRADRRRARAAAGRRRHPGLGDRRGGRGAGRLAAVLRARHHASATTTSTASGTRSAATATGSAPGWTSTCSPGRAR